MIEKLFLTTTTPKEAREILFDIIEESNMAYKFIILPLLLRLSDEELQKIIAIGKDIILDSMPASEEEVFKLLEKYGIPPILAKTIIPQIVKEIQK